MIKLSLGLCGALCYPVMLHSPDRHTEFMRLSTVFLVNRGHLALFIRRPFVDPLEGILSLYNVVGNNSTLISSMNSLSGLVKIDSPAKALAFARLRTSPRTFHALLQVNDPVELEVLPRSLVTSALLYGDSELADRLRKAGDGYWGIISMASL